MSASNQSPLMAYISILPIATQSLNTITNKGFTKNSVHASIYTTTTRTTRVQWRSVGLLGRDNHTNKNVAALRSKISMTSNDEYQHEQNEHEQEIQIGNTNNNSNNASLAMTAILIASASIASLLLFPQIHPAIASTVSSSTSILHQSDFLLGFVAQLQRKAIDLLPFEGIEGLYSYILSLGIWGEFVYGFIYFVLELVAIPALPLTLGAGFLFGAVKGTVTVSLAANAAAGVSFLISRYLLRDIVSRYAMKNSTFRKIDRAIGTHGFRIVLLLRLSPLLPFSLSNYLYGITSVNFWEYVGGTVLGMLPGTIAYVYGGNAGREISGHSGSPNWFTLALGVLATIGAVTILGRIATDAMKEDLPDSDGEFEGGDDGIDEATGLPLSKNFRISNGGGEHVAAIKGSKSVLKISSDDEGPESDLSP